MKLKYEFPKVKNPAVNPVYEILATVVLKEN